MTTMPTAAASAPGGSTLHRLSFRFSGLASHAACLASHGRTGLAVERWSFAGPRPVRRVLPTPGETIRTQPIPGEDGRVVLVRNRPGTHRVSVVQVEGRQAVERTVAVLDSRGLRGITSLDPATLAWLIAFERSDCSTIYRIDAQSLGLERVLSVPGQFSGAAWLTEKGDQLATDHTVDGVRRIVSVNLRDASVSAIADPGTGLLLAVPKRSELLVAAVRENTPRLGWLAAGSTVARFPAGLNSIAATVLPLVADPSGNRLALRVTDGVRSRLLTYDLDADLTTEVTIPAGVVRTAGWGAHGLHLLHSAPTRPADVVTIAEPAALASRPPQWSPGRPSPDSEPAGHDARVETFDGAAGAIEAVVYGADWRRSRRVLVALHGGPEAAWDLGFDPTFQRLAAEGISVIAPNQRGSTGYGAAHRNALKGAWGGPDLDDVRSIAASIASRRDTERCPRPMLLGTSYGAFLALLAVAAQPQAWSRCVAIAPFLSGSRLYQDGSPAVRSLIERLGGRVELRDELGPRDLLRLCPRIQVPLLVVHGARDDVIPVAHSRQLFEHLRAARRGSAEIDFREVPDGGHNPLDGPGGDAVLDRTVQFLLAVDRYAAVA